MKALAILSFMLAISATSAYAQQKGTVTFNGNVFDTPSTQGAGYAQGPGSTQGPGYAQPPAKSKIHHVRRHTVSKHSAS